jgi:hypothetical protein
MRRTLIVGTCSALAIGYLVALLLELAPPGTVSPSLVFAVCPPTLLTLTVDPSPSTVLLVLAPLNGMIYGCVGLVIALFVGLVKQDLG